MDIHSLDCKKIEESVPLRKELLHAVRRFFKERSDTEFTDWDGTCSDEELFVYARRKYYPTQNPEKGAESALQEFWKWTYKGGKVPIYLCSYFIEAMKGRDLVLA